MVRPFPWIWVLLAAVLLLFPGPAGRLLLDFLGGLTLTLLLLPVLAGGAAFVGWQILKRRLRTCPACGLVTLGAPVCPGCGTVFPAGDATGPSGWEEGSASTAAIDPRDVTINVRAVDVDASPPRDQDRDQASG